MNTLFPIELQYPEGFQYQNDFITVQEEKELLAIIEATPLHTFQFQGYDAKRKVASFGYDWSFEKQQLTKGKEIPQEFHWLMERVAAFSGIAPADFAELLVTEYPVGAVINWHRDAPPFELIAGISLTSDCLFKLRPHAKERQTRKALLSFLVQRRSLYIMQGPVRSDWQHSTAPVANKRYSITLRTLRAAAKPLSNESLQR